MQVHNSKIANRADGQDGLLHDFVIEFDMFHMRTDSAETKHAHHNGEEFCLKLH